MQQGNLAVSCCMNDDVKFAELALNVGRLVCSKFEYIKLYLHLSVLFDFYVLFCFVYLKTTEGFYFDRSLQALCDVYQNSLTVRWSSGTITYNMIHYCILKHNSYLTQHFLLHVCGLSDNIHHHAKAKQKFEWIWRKIQSWLSSIN